MTAAGAPDPNMKSAVRDHWEDETCGTRYANTTERETFFRDVSEARYRLEPFIPEFARFESAAGKDVLEIGVGAGSDFENWCRHARHATGVDLTEAAIRLTSERLALGGVNPSTYTLRQSDAEHLPFDDASFDIVYSWGVLHHTPDTPAALAEVFRVLKPGGTMRAMIYHVPSWTGLLLLARHGWSRGKLRMTQRTAIYEQLESPGTKAYTVPEAKQLIESRGFTDVNVSTVLCPADLLSLKLRSKYDGAVSRAVMALYPRWLVRLLGNRLGLFLLIDARKP
jgi:ubiquinone/menaquinone biosynthesis C-methylase UbiE